MEPEAIWLQQLGYGVVLALAWATCWAVPAISLRRNDIADVVWGLIFPYLTLLLGAAVVLPDWREEPRAAIVVVLVSAWALRLTIHLAGRYWRSDGGEDRRYARWREQWGTRWRIRSLLQVFWLQSLIALVVAQPLVVAACVATGDVRLGVLDAVAVALVFTGMSLESIADRQLARFLRRREQDPSVGRYLQSGTWSWSRHPNYAGDAIMWWGFGLFGIAAAIDAGVPVLAVPSIVGPVVMTLLLRYGSGVTLAERGRAGDPEWDAYVQRTSPFLPRPPRSRARAVE